MTKESESLRNPEGERPRGTNPLTISVCIATHERSNLLLRTLEALALQTRLPDEIVVSDSSQSESGPGVVAEFADRHPRIPVRHLRSVRKALPWHRWRAFQSSRGGVVLFIDDDIQLHATALDLLERAYATLGADPSPRVAGVGLLIAFEGDATRNIRSIRERWLGTSSLPHGAVTRGGLTVSIAGLTGKGPVETSVLSGGAMSFYRRVLDQIFELDHLIALYEAGIGRGEDAVLSSCARRFGRLYVLPEPLASHVTDDTRRTAPYARDGWRLGMTQTFGRAHTMKWMAMKPSAYRKDWCRLVALELGRCGLAIIRRPWSSRDWLHLGGACYGAALTLFRWKRIPARPSSQRTRATNSIST